MGELPQPLPTHDKLPPTPPTHPTPTTACRYFPGEPSRHIAPRAFTGQEGGGSHQHLSPEKVPEPQRKGCSAGRSLTVHRHLGAGRPSPPRGHCRPSEVPSQGQPSPGGGPACLLHPFPSVALCWPLLSEHQLPTTLQPPQACVQSSTRQTDQGVASYPRSTQLSGHSLASVEAAWPPVLGCLPPVSHRPQDDPRLCHTGPGTTPTSPRTTPTCVTPTPGRPPTSVTRAPGRPMGGAVV